MSRRGEVSDEELMRLTFEVRKYAHIRHSVDVLRRFAREMQARALEELLEEYRGCADEYFDVAKAVRRMKRAARIREGKS
jgi:hypothetical protein